MSNTTNSKACLVVGLVISAMIVGVLSYFIGLVAPMWLAVIAFVILLAVGYLASARFCSGVGMEQADLVRKPVPLKEDAAPEVVEAPVVEEPAAPVEGLSGLLDKPRGGAGDDLKKIKGVGPKLETDLNGKGIWHYDQIAAWSAEDVAWADDNLIKFKGRVSRDDWVGQAKTLGAGGDTAFSKKVDKGGVY